MNYIVREFGFDMGHMLPDHQGACYRPHGHRYRGEVCVTGDLQPEGSERGMVTDFAVLREAIDTNVIALYDHRFAVCIDDPRWKGMVDLFDGDDLVACSDPPTVENLAGWIGRTLQVVLPDVRVMSVRLWETPTCSATWTT